MISRTTDRKILVQTRDESIKIELIPFLVKSFLEALVLLQICPEKDDFEVGLCFFIIRDN